MLISTSTGICTSVLHRSEKYFTCEEALTQIAGAGFRGGSLLCGLWTPWYADV